MQPRLFIPEEEARMKVGPPAAFSAIISPLTKDKGACCSRMESRSSECKLKPLLPDPFRHQQFSHSSRSNR